MSTLLDKSRYLTIIGVLGLLAAAIAAFVWGTIQTVQTIVLIAQTMGADQSITVALLEIVDSFLIATTLLIFSVGLYELFIGDIPMPEWMVIHNLDGLKAKLSNMIIMVMAVKFVEKLVDVKSYSDLLYFGGAVTLVSAALIAFGYFGHKE
jgi:uncharacterized membrane protein YqhA